MSLKNFIVASVQGTDLSLHELLQTLKLRGRLRAVIADGILDKVIANAVEKERIKVGDEELQKAADAFRISAGLNKAADTQRWLAANHLSQADYETGLERALQRQKLVEKVVPRERVDKFFAENRARFDRARLSQIVVEKEGTAAELLSQLQEDELDFAEAARKHSIDERTKERGGRRGIVSRKRMTPPIEAAVFAAQPGAVVGPFKTERGHHLLKVEELLPGQLSPRLAALIRERLFQNWLRDQVRNGKVQVRLYEEL